ncbi:hypothetical protein WR25_24675 [Diploscapter pachys]|uniref:Thyroglobulin type-1 domain-containing protein n=1 Tax=Diploscapter pachys TaxID=2018661 RepID=A0A2A2LNH8_9BILA|nr:hypothetical protein WR25_24675 [Diploscapter pachys]
MGISGIRFIRLILDTMLILLLLTNVGAVSPIADDPKLRPQICNNGTQFECICRIPDEMVLERAPYKDKKKCTQLIKVGFLSSIQV